MNLVKKIRKNNNGGELTTAGSNKDLAFRHEWNQTLNRLRSFFENPWSDVPDLAPWPAIDMSENEKAVVLRVDVPGINPKNLEVELSGNLLTIRGSREEETKSDKGGIWRHERHEGSFLRTITLPSYVELSKVEAKCDKGVLTVTVAKTPGAGPQRVEVKTE